MSVASPAEPPTRRWPGYSRGQAWAIVGLAALLVVGGLVLVPTFLTSWGAAAHWTCASGTVTDQEVDAWIPDVLVNSPYGGSASGVGVLPAGFPGGLSVPYGVGTSASNGSAYGAFFEVNLSYADDVSDLALGPGANVRCALPLQVDVRPPLQGGGTATPIDKPSNLSDMSEARNATIFAGLLGAVPSPAWFNNSFSQPNGASVSTCGLPAQTASVRTFGLRLSFPITVGNRSYSLPFVLPATELFTYRFPGNFGTWEIDNLSAPGGPGGGWAFSYVPCSN